jgi:hypothetical protein
VQEVVVRHIDCLPLAVGLVSAFASTHKTVSAGELLAELKRATPTAAVEEGHRKGLRVELHSLKKAEHNGKQGKLLDFDAVTERWGVKLSLKERLSVRLAGGRRVSAEHWRRGEAVDGGHPGVQGRGRQGGGGGDTQDGAV